MQYRKFGKLDFSPSALGFGCMRLPSDGDKPFSPDIKDDEAIRMIRRAIDLGVNYFDTAYVYHGGRSEAVLGKALLKGYRSKVKIATKLPLFTIKKPEDFDRILDEQLKRLKVEQIDFYLLHSLDKARWDTVIRLDLLGKAEKALREGKIAHLGFSFHDEPEVFKEIVDGYDKWEFCQIQLNYLNENYQAGLPGMRYAAERGLGVVVMEPLYGGRLVSPHSAVTEIFKQADPEKTPVQWALDYIWNMPEVSLLLSGMNSMAEVEANVSYAERSEVSKLTADSQETIRRVQEEFARLNQVPCTKCAYCMPCPSGVDIPENIELYNGISKFGGPESSRHSYMFMKQGGSMAGSCTGCGECAAKCPQHIDIPGLMPKIHEQLN